VLVLLSGFLVCAQCACARAAGPVGKGRPGTATVDGLKSADRERADLSSPPADSSSPGEAAPPADIAPPTDASSLTDASPAPQVDAPPQESGSTALVSQATALVLQADPRPPPETSLASHAILRSLPREPGRSVRLPADAHLGSHLAQAPSRVQPVHRLAAMRGHDRRPRATPSVDPNGTATPQMTGVGSSASVGMSWAGSRVAVQAILLALLPVLAAPCSSKLAGASSMFRSVALVSSIDRPG
jgi:hypothetical protein